MCSTIRSVWTSGRLLCLLSGVLVFLSNECLSFSGPGTLWIPWNGWWCIGKRVNRCDPYHSDIDMVLINASTETTHKRNWSVALLISWKPWLRAQVIPGSCINPTSNLLIEMSLYHPSVHYITDCFLWGVPFIVIFLQSFTASDDSAHDRPRRLTRAHVINMYQASGTRDVGWGF